MQSARTFQVMRSSLARTLATGPGKYHAHARVTTKDLAKPTFNDATSKIWSYHAVNNGQVSRSLSPFAQNINANVFTEMMRHQMSMWKGGFGDYIWGLAFLVFIPTWSDSTFAGINFHHRD
jgi:hypothetical protein